MGTTPTSVSDGIGQAISSAKDAALGIVTSNVLYLFAVPAAFVAYKVGRKLFAKLG